MSKQFFSKLSQNYIEILDDNDYYDVLFEIGDDAHMKEFRAHAIILSYRSPYFRRHFSEKKKIDDGLFRMKFQNFSPEIFEITLKYIYGGLLSLNGYDNISEIIKILLVADEFHLQELVDYLQKYLIEEKSEWIDKNFDLVHKTSLKSICFTELQQYCINLMSSYPDKILKSSDFTSLDEKSLVPLLQKSDLQIEEIDIWLSVLKWGLKRNPTLKLDPSNWTDEKFKLMQSTLKNVLPHIRFFSLSSKEFLEQVHPYKKMLKPNLYEDLLKYFLDPNSDPPKNNYLAPRYYGKFNTKIINIDIVSLISKWIDNVKHERKFPVREKLYLPYEFNLILRGSKDGFTPKKFHSLCDNKENTVIFIKIKGTNEIIGGYNPIKWSSQGDWLGTEKSFIFSIRSKEFGIKDAIFSKVKDKDRAIKAGASDGPGFGDDIKCYGNSDKNFENILCQKRRNYEKEIRNTEDKFSMEDYEVFQIKKKK